MALRECSFSCLHKALCACDVSVRVC